MNVLTYLLALNIHGPCFTTPSLFACLCQTKNVRIIFAENDENDKHYESCCSDGFLILNVCSHILHMRYDLDYWGPISGKLWQNMLTHDIPNIVVSNYIVRSKASLEYLGQNPESALHTFAQGIQPTQRICLDLKENPSYLLLYVNPDIWH